MIDDAFQTLDVNKTLVETPAEPTLLANRYRVVRQLGQGGMGSVWLAEDTKLDGRSVAIKMLPSVLVTNKRAYAQVKQEALVSLKLSHPNIATVRAFEEEGGNPFLVMDYIDGQSLDDNLGERGKLTEAETVALLGPVADALDYAHGKGVVHRDVKPGNVMIAKDGTPYVLDFGIAREIQETMTRVTGKNSSGTLMYMSPEQLRGAAPKPKQDVYSFAAMAYECLTGHPPFSRGNVEYQIVNEPPEPLDPSVGIARQVMAGLAKTADGRPATCRAVVTEVPAQSEEKIAAADEAVTEVRRRGLPSHNEENKKDGLYKVIDLMDGSVTNLEDVPAGGWADEHKTSKLVLRRIDAGTFMMGSAAGEEGRSDDEKQHRVTLTQPYYMGVFEVTQGQWERVMGNCPSRFSTVISTPSWIGRSFRGETEVRTPNAKRPVEQVSWDDCVSFCRKAGHGLRLPTEAEWEYACRAGTSSAFAGTGRLEYMGWFCNNAGHETHDVGTKRPNDWGLYDMHGNVWEWCGDWYGAYGGDVSDPAGPASGGGRVRRGGSWFGNARFCRSARRDGDTPGTRGDYLGFRLCCSAGPSK